MRPFDRSKTNKLIENTPLLRYITEGPACTSVEYTYYAAGNLLQRTHYHPLGTLNPLGGLMQLTSGPDPGTPTLQSMTDTVSYCGPFEYKDGSLSRVNFTGGYVSGGKAYHYIRDHQGNVRQVVDAATGSVEQENHYYPGGMLFGESSATFYKKGSSTNPYRYGEKELLSTDGLDLYLHGARMYDPALLRFITPDPLRHETPHLSSYLYCAANPVMLVDPTGMIVEYGKEGEEKMRRYIDILKQNKFFNTYFQELENSSETFTIMFGETTHNGNQCPGYYISDTNTIVINANNNNDNNNNKDYQAILEETFHAYQDLCNMMDTRKENYNVEYEAKTAMMLVMLGEVEGIPALAGDIPIGMGGTYTFINKCLQGSAFLSGNKSELYKELNSDYSSGGARFVRENEMVTPKQPAPYLVRNVEMTQEFLNLIIRSFCE